MNKQQREMQKMALKAQKLAMKTVQQQQKKEALVGTRIFVQVQVRDSHNHTEHTLVHTPHTFFFRSEFLFLCLHETISKHSSFTNSQTKKNYRPRKSPTTSDLELWNMSIFTVLLVRTTLSDIKHIRE